VMSFFETTVCDYCGQVNNGSVVPDTWVTFNGEHYCGKYCAVTNWEYYSEDGVLNAG
jgi:hypothetical protein